MRSVLFNIPLQAILDLGPLGQVPWFGWGIVLIVWILGGGLWAIWHRRRHAGAWPDSSSFVVWGVIAFGIISAPAKESLPIYGFGTMLFLAYVVSAWLGAGRLRRRGVAGEAAWDVAIWIFGAGLIGARLFFIIQYRNRFFSPDKSFMETLLGIISLPDGGLVLYGGLLFAPVAYWLFCRRRGLRPLPLADLLIPFVFTGLMFGRLGCLLHGCCFGDYCELPWAITFPRESAPYVTQVFRGFLPNDPSILRSLPLHPTQIYDSLNALAIASFLWAYHPYRRRDGDVVGMAMIIYPINRFTIELLRWDESGQFGTRLTISQWGSLAIVAVGIAFLLWRHRSQSALLPLQVELPEADISATASA